MSVCCPHCKSEDVQSLAGAFAAADTEALVRRAAPPRKASCLFIIQIWFLATMTMDILARLFWGDMVRGLILSGLYIVAAFGVARAWAYNRYQWPALYHKWQHSYICLGCSKVFQRK